MQRPPKMPRILRNVVSLMKIFSAKGGPKKQLQKPEKEGSGGLFIAKIQKNPISGFWVQFRAPEAFRCRTRDTPRSARIDPGMPRVPTHVAAGLGQPSPTGWPAPRARVVGASQPRRAACLPRRQLRCHPTCPPQVCACHAANPACLGQPAAATWRAPRSAASCAHAVGRGPAQ